MIKEYEAKNVGIWKYYRDVLERYLVKILYRLSEFEDVCGIWQLIQICVLLWFLFIF